LFSACAVWVAWQAYLTKVVAARRKVDFVALTWLDWIPYGGVPALGNACLVVGAGGLAAGKSFALCVIAGATALFLFCGIYGAWDLTLWIVVRGRKPWRGAGGQPSGRLSVASRSAIQSRTTRNASPMLPT
jgi:hypothetical protein